jgi:hypothetical protein
MASRRVVVYNVQRLFRPGGSRIARALDATEERGWTAAVYRRKVQPVGTMLANATAGERPALLVLIEVEDGHLRDVAFRAAKASAPLLRLEPAVAAMRFPTPAGPPWESHPSVGQGKKTAADIAERVQIVLRGNVLLAPAPALEATS